MRFPPRIATTDKSFANLWWRWRRLTCSDEITNFGGQCEDWISFGRLLRAPSVGHCGALNGTTSSGVIQRLLRQTWTGEQDSASLARTQWQDGLPALPRQDWTDGNTTL